MSSRSLHVRTFATLPLLCAAAMMGMPGEGRACFVDDFGTLRVTTGNGTPSRSI